ALRFALISRTREITAPPQTKRGAPPSPLLVPPTNPPGQRGGNNPKNIVAGLTMSFGPPPAPPPPPPPAPPPPPTHQVYLVFFDWDKYNITPEGQQIIVLAANQYKAGGRVQIQVNGYTDTTGSFGYNHRLSHRPPNPSPP